MNKPKIEIQDWRPSMTHDVLESHVTCALDTEKFYSRIISLDKDACASISEGAIRGMKDHLKKLRDELNGLDLT